MFKNRTEAAKKLASELIADSVINGSVQGLVLAIPRGGVILGKIIAQALSWPLSLIIAKKISVPFQPELAMGAIAEDGLPLWHKQVLAGLALTSSDKNSAIKIAQQKIKKYQKMFRSGKQLQVKNKRVIVVDDGAATGKTLEAAIVWLKSQGVKQLISALPVCAQDTAKHLKPMVDQWVCLIEPPQFYAVGQFYKEFEQVGDEQVVQLMRS